MGMKPVTRNLLANYFGRGWNMAVNLIATPLLIKVLGIESYGLIGFYTTMYGVINLLDFGISPTINRELAQYSVDDNKRGQSRDLVRTLEIGYWILGVLLGILVFYGSPFIARYWLQSSDLSEESLISAIRLMGFIIVLEWPITFYQGALLGMQRHVRLNAINITNSLLKYGGGLLILIFVSPTITAFFLWQLIISAFVIIFLVISVWSSLPPKEGKPSFNQQLLQRIWKFALSLNLISFIGLVIHQIDKLFVSHFFLLNIFGYYNLATTVTSGFTMLVSPIFLTFFPKLSSLVAQKDEISLRRVYHQACQLVSAAILPAATTGILFSHKIISLWTGDPSIADKTAPIASILLLGTAINSLATMPYQAQISHGWTRLALFSNLISLPVIVTLLFGLNAAYGIQGVALIWPIHNLYMLIITVPLMHRRILKGEFSVWLLKDTGIPVFICLAFATIITISGETILDYKNNILVLIGFALITQIGVIFALPYTREKSILYIKTFTRKVLHGF